MGSLVPVLLQMFSLFRQWNKFEKRLIFDEVNAYEVKAYKNSVPVLGHPLRARLINNVAMWMPLNISLSTESLISGMHYHAMLILQHYQPSNHGCKTCCFFSVDIVYSLVCDSILIFFLLSCFHYYCMYHLCYFYSICIIRYSGSVIVTILILLLYIAADSIGFFTNGWAQGGAPCV